MATSGKSVEVPELQIFRTVLFYSVGIIILPVLTFFAFKCLLLHSVFSVPDVSGNVMSAVAAVLVLHISLGIFIYKAYSESSITPKKQD